MDNTYEQAADRAFFARLGLAFAVAILVSGIMMVAVGPTPAERGEGQIASLERSSSVALAGSSDIRR